MNKVITHIVTTNTPHCTQTLVTTYTQSPHCTQTLFTTYTQSPHRHQNVPHKDTVNSTFVSLQLKHFKFQVLPQLQRHKLVSFCQFWSQTSALNFLNIENGKQTKRSFLKQLSSIQMKKLSNVLLLASTLCALH